jgi:anti-sigma-K factor RskA
MSTPKRYLNSELIKALAAQYVCGLMRGQARQRFVSLMQQHRQIREAVGFWEQRLDVLNGQLKDVPASPKVWNRLAQRIDAPRRGVADSASWKSWLGSAWLSMAGITTSLVLAVFIIWQQQQPPIRVNYVAVLADSQGEAQIVATTSKISRQLDLEILQPLPTSPEQAAGHYVIWARSKLDTSLYQLGTLQDSKRESIALDELAWQKVKDSHSLFVTYEPPGNTGAPSSAPLASGLCVMINYDLIDA